MITPQLINPQSIVVVGGSEDIQKPGGRALKNLIDYAYKGKLYVVNPKADTIQGIFCHRRVEDLPQTDLAIISLPAALCPSTVETLCTQKETKAFIIFSAGFHEESEEGARLEAQIVESVNRAGASLIGPNCIGVMNQYYTGVFTLPVPPFSPTGVDLISGSGATALFIVDAAMRNGISFSNVFSVGNSAQMGVEEVLRELDLQYIEGESAPVKLLYIESINKPDLLLKHAASLIRKGVRIAAIKAGYSEAGSRAASSHTGALASPDKAVDALFRKAGIIRCYGRDELVTVASILLQPLPKGKRMAIITHAGGPAVMLTDALSENKIQIPHFEGAKADALLKKLYPGSSVANPIDFLATGTAEQLGAIIDFCQHDVPDIDAMAIIFGSPGLTPVFDAYDMIDQKMKSCTKPIYPIFPSNITVRQEIAAFKDKGRIFFPDEVLFGAALSRILNTPAPVEKEIALQAVDTVKIRHIIDTASDGYLLPEQVQQLLDAAGIARAQERVVHSGAQAEEAANQLGFPLVMKVVGPVHKSDVGGVTLNVIDLKTVRDEFKRMKQIEDAVAVLMQSQLSGTQLFVGAKREGGFGHTVLCGLGGIFIEVLKDISHGLSPLSKEEAQKMIQSLRSYSLIKGVRGQEGVNEEMYRDIICKLSALCNAAPEIAEMDINPLLGTPYHVTAVDARIRIEKP
ncbi:MAG: acetate--CoA ligase family protein [Bacteroidales bacterium]|nr:acetate--CoA ligase family protein [Bacteroidales bacterium]